MHHRFRVTARELALLAYLSEITELPSLWTAEVKIDPKDVEQITRSLREKKLLVKGKDGLFHVAGCVPFLLGIASKATERAEVRTYARGKVASLLYICVRGEDILLAGYDARDGYEFVWVPTLQMAVGGLLAYLQSTDDGIDDCDGRAEPCRLAGMSEWTFARAQERALGSDGTETMVVAFKSAAFPQDAIGFARKNGRLYVGENASADQYRRMKKLEATLPVSRWLVQVYREQLIAVKGG